MVCICCVQVMLPQCERARSTSGRPEGPYRAVESVDGLTTQNFDGIDTLDKLFVHAVKRFSQAPCLGTREVLSEEEEKQANGKLFKKVNSSNDLCIFVSVSVQLHQQNMLATVDIETYLCFCL